MKVAMSATIKEKHDSKQFVSIQVEDRSFNLYLHDLDEDDCYGMTLNQDTARTLAKQLESLADFLLMTEESTK